MATLLSFDIFSGVIDRSPIWICSVEGLENAKKRMEQIAAEKPGAYFVFSGSMNKVLASIETSTKKPFVVGDPRHD